MQRSTGGEADGSRTGFVHGLIGVMVLACASTVVAQPAPRIASDVAALRSVVWAPGPITRPASGVYDVVALRVEFQPDTTRYTTGDGTFDGELFTDGLEASIDPLPHDAAYFEAHLAFLRHYVATVSGGRAEVRTHLLPDVVRVSGRMGDYAPTGPDSDSDVELAKLAALVDEAWAGVTDASGLPALDPDRTAFVLFHAGVGRDIELVGTTLDKTPEDLPSLFFGADALDRLVPGPRPGLAGVSVTNSLLIPRTETRQGFDFISDEPFLAEFSINGMLAASFLNYLGVPDLFDTTTGESAIGPFGVMDGLGIFAMSGLFPPQPSAWTRQYLAWVDPVMIEPGDPERVTLGQGGAAVVRVPVSGAEYFLAEARHRDPDGTGVRLTVLRDGEEEVMTFANGDPDFNPVSVDGFPGGVVTSAQPYDFALPGGLDDNDNPLLGGVLIWHVDERVLAGGLATNSVNADPDHRAVDLEEADGAQDIGHPTGGIFGPAFDLGSPFDFWYEGNPVSVLTTSGDEITLYENRFGPDTVPDSRNNLGGPSFVEIGDFSVVAPTMDLSIRRVSESGIDLARTVDLPVGGGPSPLGGSAWIHPIPSRSGMYAIAGSAPSNEVGSLFVQGLETFEVLDVWPTEPVVAADGTVIALRSDGFVGTDGFSDRLWPFDRPRVLTGNPTPIVALPGEQPAIVAGLSALDEGHLLLRLEGDQITRTVEPEPVVSLAVTDDGRLIVVGLSKTRVEGGGVTWVYPTLEVGKRYRPAFGRDRDGLFGVVTAGSVLLLQPDGGVVSVGSSLLSSGFPGESTRDVDWLWNGLQLATTVADLDGDGLLDALVTDGSTVWAFHRSGAVVDGFPIRFRAPIGTGAPLVTRIEGTEGPVIVAGLADGSVDAVSVRDRGRSVRGFPLAVGAGPVAAPLVDDGRIVAVDSRGQLRVWSFDRDLEATMALATPGNASFVVLDGTAEVAADGHGLLLDSETYNWPNPVQDGAATWIRFALTEAAAVDIAIHDLSGRRVDHIHVASPPVGTPYEVGWPAQVPSGVYYARVRATTPGGRTEDRLVKIAVIR